MAVNKLVPKTSFVIFEEISYKGKQSIEYCLIGSISKGDKQFKIKIKIDRDSYDFQSSAIGYVFDGIKWETIYSIPYPEMKTPNKVYSNEKVSSSFFTEDKNRIFSMLERLLYVF